MITCEVFLAESCGPASFGRRNLFGVNFGRRILVPVVPYALDAVFIVVIRAPANTVLDDTRLTLTASWGETFDNHVGRLAVADGVQAYYVEWSRLNFILQRSGWFTITATATGFSCTATWQVEVGSGPWRQNSTTLPPSSVVDGRKPWSPLLDLAREVRASLVVVDQYATPTFLRTFLPPGPNGWVCRVIVSKSVAKKHQAEWPLLKQDFSGLEVRVDDLIHDRFVLRDDEEAYAFGHSLKDLGSGRLSFFSRVYDDEQFQLIRNAVEESWQRAAVVL